MKLFTITCPVPISDIAQYYKCTESTVRKAINKGRLASCTTVNPYHGVGMIRAAMPAAINYWAASTQRKPFITA